ncbi:MAG: hypothetical protein HQM16_07310 [Deltaproteobacteria bacterium]|nr:hypothetical protein [Deltaproteobacteria bacterium]
MAKAGKAVCTVVAADERYELAVCKEACAEIVDLGKSVVAGRAGGAASGPHQGSSEVKWPKINCGVPIMVVFK